MEIKPIRPIQPISPGELPEVRPQLKSPILPPPRPPQGKWNYTNKQIFFNGENIGELLTTEPHKGAAFWSQLANDLILFRNDYIRRHIKRRKKKVGDQIVLEEYDPTGELSHLAALVEAYIAKIMRFLKKKYDETASGLSYTLDENGQLILNGMNIISFLEMARTYPTKKARLFLKGLKTRLYVILSSKNSASSFEKIRDLTLTMIEQIDLELERIVEKERLIDNT